MDDLLLAIPDFLEEHQSGPFPDSIHAGAWDFPVHDVKDEDGQRYLVFQIGLPEWLLAEIEGETFGHMVGFRIQIEDMPDNIIPFPIERVKNRPIEG
jgi:hypothetical protein